MSKIKSVRGVEQYREKGYVVLDGLFEDEVPALCASLQKLIDANRHDAGTDWNSPGFVYSPEADNKVVQKVQGIGTVMPSVLDDVFRHPKLLTAVRVLSKETLDFFGTKFFPMYPGQTSVHWHQDNHYFGTASRSIISCAIYLQDTDRENGALRVIPRSHLGGAVAHAPGKGRWANGEWCAGDEHRAIDITCRAGTVVLFNAMLIHGAHPNTATAAPAHPRTRFSLFCHFVPTHLGFKWRGVDFSRGKYLDRYGTNTALQSRL